LRELKMYTRALGVLVAMLIVSIGVSRAGDLDIHPDGHFNFLHLWPGQIPPLDRTMMLWVPASQSMRTGSVGVLRGFLGVDKSA
jgi:hypothetical protein